MDRSAWDARYRDTEWLWSVEPNRFLVDEVRELPPGRALDLAAGEGRNAVWLAELGWRVTAVDFSAVALERARTLAAARDVAVQLVEADLRDYAPEPASFDLVLVLYLHLPAPARDAVLQRATAAVAPGGTLLVVGHDLENLTRGYGGPRDASVLATPDEVATVVAAARDMVIEKAERVRREVATPDGPVDAIDHVVRARRVERV